MTTANDQFTRYFTEKIWGMIPAIYRHEDGLGKIDLDKPFGVLHALVEVWAEQAAILRRSQDQLWEDQFIDLCNDWAVPYIADLLGTRMLSVLDNRGRRIDVAKTMYYRRRKGTPRILEELISDISGWDGKLVENFQRLGRARHGLDPKPAPLAGRLTGTPPGGWADLRQPHAAELTDGPFDEFHHTPDFRRPRGLEGRYGIPKLTFYLYPLVAYRVEGVTPFALGDGIRYTFDPSGRDVPLFSRRKRPDDWEQWRTAFEWELQAPIRCRLLNQADYQLTEEAVQTLVNDHGLTTAAADELRRLSGWTFNEESQLRATLNTLTSRVELLSPTLFPLLLRHTIQKTCGKSALLPDALAVDADGSPRPDTGSLAVTVGASPAGTLTAEFITAANLTAWPIGSVIDKALAVDPERGRFDWLDGLTRTDTIGVTYYYGFSGPVGAGTYDRRAVDSPVPAGMVKQQKAGGGPLTAADLLNDGITQLDDSQTYGPVVNKTGVRNMTLQAANQQRPYLRLATNWILRSVRNAQLIIDGLWIGAAASRSLELIIQGNYESVILRNCTLDPGGDQTAAGLVLNPLTLVIEGTVKKMCIDQTITGPVLVRDAGVVEELIVCDSIIQSVDSSVAAIQLRDSRADLRRTTVFGAVNVHSLDASEVISTGLVTVTNTQTGCFRFSAALAEALIGSGLTPSRLPRPYESFLFPDDTTHWFTSRRFGQPGYAQLSQTAPVQLRRRAENGSEMGAFSSLLNPIKEDGLTAKVAEYMPFGLIPTFVHQT